MPRSLRFYVDGLGFEVQRSMDDDRGVFWASLEKDGMRIMISNRPSRFLDFLDHGEGHFHEHPEDEAHEHFHGVGAVHDGALNFVTFVYVANADAAFEELRGRGVETIDSPQDKFYGVREFLLRDPDGYYYAIAQTL
jgi:uncharacterized glyoxalase superfamily protein PhnB